MNFNFDLSLDKRAFQVKSKPIKLYVKFADHDGEIETLEGKVSYMKGDAIMTGSQGEQWPIGRKRFFQNYMLDENSPEGDNVYQKISKTVWAKLIEEQREIPLPNGKGVLNGSKGDYLVQYAPGDCAVINQDIFMKTYEITNKSLK